MKSIFLLLALVLAVQPLPAQAPDDDHDPANQHGIASYAPLPLFTTGSGRIVPFQDGQMLEVGRSYVMAAIPHRGYIFTNWQPVNVFTETVITVDDNGVTNAPITSVVVSPAPPSSARPVLRFTMQPEIVVANIPGVVTITETSGWQANFVPGRRRGLDRDESRHEDPE